MAFGSSTPFSFTSIPQQHTPILGQPQPQPQPQQQQQALHQVHLLTKEKAPATYHTKWADLHPDSHNFLLQIETRILEYRDESRRLDQCDRLFNSTALNEGFEVDAARISQELGGISTAMDREKVSLQELMKTAKELMRNAEVAVRSYVILRSRFPRPVALPAFPSSNVPVATGTVGTVGGASAPTPTQAMSSMLPVDFYSGVPIKPSPFLVHTVSRFEHQLQEFRQWVEELERLLFADINDNGKDGTYASLLQCLPVVLSNIHDFFIHVTAKVETLHQQTWSMRTAYLANQRKRGEDSNPFLEADRREVAKKEAAAKRVHPTLQASTAVSQLSTPAAGFLSATGAAPSSGPSGTTTPSLFAGSSSFPAFGTTSSISSFPSAPSFSTSAPATTSLFGASSGQSATPSLFGSGTSSSLFGSGPTAGSTNTLLSPFPAGSAASSSSSLFGGTPVPSSGLFGSSMPSLSGQTSGSLFGGVAGASAFGMGTSQGTTTNKAKSRTTRRK